ncbi:MAG TPA: FtsX-like permease family protein, partial [Gammaproteobacteria bacterium]|nr:FtsX-like permease family protein [Gammaproteobacteria bacterium]
GSARMRNALVVAEITLTAVLLVGAGLLLHSYIAVLNVNPGFQPQHLLLAETDLSPSKYADFTARREFYERVLERVKALPGVAGAGYANYPPLVFNGGRALVTIEGQPALPPQDLLRRNMASDRAVSAQYFSALGVPLLRGRYFDERDGPKSAPAVLINQTMAKRHWPGENPVGKRFKVGVSNSDSPWRTVVGVVGNVRQMSLDAPVEPAFYLSLAQTSASGPFFWPQYLLVRTQGDPMSLAAAVRNAVWAVDPDQPVSNVRPMTQVFDQQLSGRNTQLTLVGGLAVLALLLAAVGLYGVLSYMVAQRTSEIGLRMALGAQQGNVVGSVVRSALLLAVLGIAVGLAAAFGLSRLLASFLFGIGPSDPATFVAVPVLLVLVTIVASYVPARRAASVDPVSALRAE